MYGFYRAQLPGKQFSIHLLSLSNLKTHFMFFFSLFSDSLGLTMGFGICGPATCSEEVLLAIVDTVLLQVNVKNVTVQMIPHTCQKDEPLTYRPEDIAVLYV